LFLIDKPLVIVGKTSQTWSVNVIAYDGKVRSYKEEIGDKFSLSLFNGEYIHNGIVESLLRVKHGDPERFKNYNIDMARYCCLYYQDMLDASKQGHDTNADFKEFYWKLPTLPSNVQKKVHSYIRKARIKEFLRRSPLYNIIAAIRMLTYKLYILFKKDGAIKLIRGTSVGVYDIASCADHLVEIAQALKQRTDAWDYRRAPTSCEHGD
jgi:hypothetical protein